MLQGCFSWSRILENDSSNFKGILIFLQRTRTFWWFSFAASESWCRLNVKSLMLRIFPCDKLLIVDQSNISSMICWNFFGNIHVLMGTSKDYLYLGFYQLNKYCYCYTILYNYLSIYIWFEANLLRP